MKGYHLREIAAEMSVAPDSSAGASVILTLPVESDNLMHHASQLLARASNQFAAAMHAAGRTAVISTDQVPYSINLDLSYTEIRDDGEFGQVHLQLTESEFPAPGEPISAAIRDLCLRTLTRFRQRIGFVTAIELDAGDPPR